MADPTPGNGTYSGLGQNLGNDVTAVIQMITNNMDQIIQQEAKTNGMQASPQFVQSLGNAGQVKLATLETTGLGNYDKIKGYPMGQATLTWQAYTLEYDRALKVVIDSRDQQETAGLLTAAATFAELTRSQVVPELDATRMARLYSRLNALKDANDPNVVTAAKPTKANAVSTLIEYLNRVENITGQDTGLTVYVNAELKSIFDLSSEVTLNKSVDGAGNAITIQNRTINGHNLVYVPSARMKTTITLNDGYTNALTDEDDLSSVDPSKYGFTGGAKSIWYAITPPGVANAVTVINKPKYITAEASEQFDGDSIAYRIYHDLIVPKNKAPAAFMLVQS